MVGQALYQLISSADVGTLLPTAPGPLLPSPEADPAASRKRPPASALSIRPTPGGLPALKRERLDRSDGRCAIHPRFFRCSAMSHCSPTHYSKQNEPRRTRAQYGHLQQGVMARGTPQKLLKKRRCRTWKRSPSTSLLSL